MNKKKEVLNLGNFSIKKENSGDHEWISIKAVSGFWSMRFRDDNMMYAVILDMARNKDFHEYLEVWIKMSYLISGTVPDVQFLQDFYANYTAMSERMVSSRNTSSDEEDNNALEEMRLLHHIKQAGKELGKEGQDEHD